MPNASEMLLREGKLNERVKTLHWIAGETKKVADLKELQALLQKYLDEAIAQQNP